MCKFPFKASVPKSVQNVFTKLCNMLPFVKDFLKSYNMWVGLNIYLVWFMQNKAFKQYA